MKRNIFALLRTFVYVALVSALSISLVACDPDDGGENAVPSVSVPEGYVNYFIDDLTFDASASQAKVVFDINVDWTIGVVSPLGVSVPWCTVTPVSGGAGLHKIMVSVTDNDLTSNRSAYIFLMSGMNKVAEILVTQEGKPDKYGPVDLGLSVKWASCNVGAESPEDYGGYYAWGEIVEKDNYIWSTYKWCIGGFENLTKYCTNRKYGNADYRTVLDSEDDVAHVKWGDGWRMPTSDEIKELISNCSWSWIYLNGVNGYKVTGPNGNSIFLPAAGYRYDYNKKEFIGRGSHGCYWSGTLRENGCYDAVYLNFSFSSHDWGGCYRSSGHTVRPVTE